MSIDARKLAVILIAAALSVAHASDRLADITIEADDAELDRATGTTYYRGNVRIAQADLEIRGDEVSLIITDGELVEATIKGTPASLTQAGGQNKPQTRAEAREMIFVMATGIIRLRGSARVSQAGDEFASDDISYDTRAERVVAGGEQGGRIQVTISPRRPVDGAEPPEEPDPDPDE